ncbi:trypsin-like [Oppia nitens]|nr:trypsin-like [Oppia nitens]
MANNTITTNNTTTNIDSSNVCLVKYFGCKDDAGNPVTIDRQKQYYNRKSCPIDRKLLIGVLTDDLYCKSGRPEVMISINPYLQWIKQKTNISAVSSSSDNTTTNNDIQPVNLIIEDPINIDPGFSHSKSRNTRFGLRYTASLMDNQSKRHFCSGTIIGTNWILTAASCLQNRTVSSIYVGVGKNDYQLNNTLYTVVQTILHDQYSPLTKQNNIALVRVEPYIRNCDLVGIIRLADKNQKVIHDRQPAHIGGWGSKTIWWFLQTLDVKIFDWQQCMSIIANNTITTNSTTIIDSSNVCVVADKGKGACHDDEGGPIIRKVIEYSKYINKRNRTIDRHQEIRVIMGVLSSDLSCGQSGRPDIVTNVITYREWIKEKTGI